MTDSRLAPWRAVGRELLQGLVRLLYPGVCGACGKPLPEEQKDFCASCQSILTADPYPACPRCAGTVGPFASVKDGCTHCRHQSLQFERALRLGPYDGLLRDVILRLKHAAGEGLAESLAGLWAAQAETRLRELAADLVMPVPLHWWRRLRRGYNQSEALARVLADRLRLPCRPSWVRRIRNTPRQVQQTAAARRDNVRGAFDARPRPELRGKTVLLVDDVLTTGSTASEAGREYLSITFTADDLKAA